MCVYIIYIYIHKKLRPIRKKLLEQISVLFSILHLRCKFQKDRTNNKIIPRFVNHPLELRASTPFEDMIFYLWTDSNEICTAYVKLKINHILFMKFF